MENQISYPPSVQSDLFNYLKPHQREAIRPYLRIVKPQYQEMLCVTLLDYLEGHGLNELQQPILNTLQDEIVQACNLRPLTSSRFKVQGSKTLGDLVRQLFPSLSSIAPHSGLDTPHSGLRAGTPSYKEMPHRVRHEAKDSNTLNLEPLNLEPAKPSSLNPSNPSNPSNL